MDEILNMKANEIAGLSFDCSCGRRHSVDIGEIIIGKDITVNILNTITDYKNSKIFLVADTNTYAVLGNSIEELLLKEGFNLNKFIFETQDHQLVPDDRSIGRLLIEVNHDIDLIIAVGSGVINDLVKHVSYKINVPFIIVGTAPSMDGYASVVTSLIAGGVKQTFEGKYPISIIGDTNIMKNAPLEMLQAGFGDVLGKLTALADWELARAHGKEGFCATTVQLVKNALKKCCDNIDGIAARDNEAIKGLMEGLVLAGIAIGLYGTSRPASGAEHYFAHHWDMDAVSKGLDHPLHGNSVGVGTVITAYTYQIMKPYIPENINIPDPDEVISLLNKLNSCTNPKDLGISRELFIDSIYNAFNDRPKYTIFHYAKEIGMLDEISKNLSMRFYGK